MRPGGGSYPLYPLHAWHWSLYLDHIDDPAASDGLRILLQYAGRYFFRLRHPDQQHAGLHAVAHLPGSAALFPRCASGRLFEGGGTGRTLAADGRDGRTGLDHAYDQRRPLPQIARLIKTLGENSRGTMGQNPPRIPRAGQGILFIVNIEWLSLTNIVSISSDHPLLV